VVAANREEYFQRPSLPPFVQEGSPRILCGLDQRAGGTWLGVNARSLFVAVTNRWGLPLPENPRSRGALCIDLLRCENAEEAMALAVSELASGRYAGANYVCIDRTAAYFASNADPGTFRELEPGLHLLANGDLNDGTDPRLLLTSSLYSACRGDVATLVERSKTICAYEAEVDQVGIILRFEDRGTVSSSIVALTDDPADSLYLHSNGSPDAVPYGDYSAIFRDILEKPV
jgi:uncharacterized protein with NRDE domain